MKWTRSKDPDCLGSKYMACSRTTGCDYKIVNRTKFNDWILYVNDMITPLEIPLRTLRGAKRVAETIDSETDISRYPGW